MTTPEQLRAIRHLEAADRHLELAPLTLHPTLRNRFHLWLAQYHLWRSKGCS